jgi:hypothetical protein
MLKRLVAWFCGTCFMVLDGLALFFTWAWLRFKPYEPQILSARGTFLIPGGDPRGALDSIDPVFYRAFPALTLVLLFLAFLFLFINLRLSKR